MRQRWFSMFSVGSVAVCALLAGSWIYSYWWTDDLWYVRGADSWGIGQSGGELYFMNYRKARSPSEHGFGALHEGRQKRPYAFYNWVLGFAFRWDNRASRTSYRGVAIPIWAVEVTAAIIASWMVRSARRNRRLSMPGICSKCGYDLRATAERCPECGTELKMVAVTAREPKHD